MRRRLGRGHHQFGDEVVGAAPGGVEIGVPALAEMRSEGADQRLARRVVVARPHSVGGVPSAELWTQFMQGQAPMMQSMMSNYIEQSKNLFFQMQEQMQQQARNVFQNFPGAFPGTGFTTPTPPSPPPGAGPAEKDKDKG